MKPPDPVICTGRLSAVAPSRGRGLKLAMLGRIRGPAGVAPSRGRGLKPNPAEHRTDGDARRPFAGAWIETCPTLVEAGSQARLSPLRGGVD